MIEERERLFWSKVNLLDTSGCWPINGSPNSSGYVGVTIGKRSMGAHVASVLYSGRTIPPGMVVDHRCKNRICVNPAHLEVVTEYVNNMRSDSIAAQNARKTHCVNGHELSEVNVYKGNDYYKGRHCRKCHAERERKRRQRLKDEKLHALPAAA